MEIAFPDVHRHEPAHRRPPRELSSLDDTQRRALSALVKDDRVWKPPIAMGPYFGNLGLPADREQLQQYLQGCRS